MTIINEDKKYRKLKEGIRMMNSQRSDTEKINLIKGGKKIGINEVIKHNKIINNSLNHKYGIYKMKSYCLKCKKNTKNINPIVSDTSNGRIVLLSKCAKCGSRKPRFIRNQEAKGLLSNLGIKTLLSKVPILGDILF